MSADKQLNLQNLARWIDSYTSGAEDRTTQLANLSVFKRPEPMTPNVCVIQPTVVAVLQGVKQMWLAGQAYQYDVDHYLLTSVELPGYSEVLQASKQQPCLGFSYGIDFALVAELSAQGVTPNPPPRSSDKDSFGLGSFDAPLLSAFCRLFELLDHPEDVDILAPLLHKEIHYRLLKSDQGHRLRQISLHGTHGQRIAKAIDWLKLNYAATLDITMLAELVQMSTSSLYQHFRQFTGMSPLQYQKWLRLNEAKRLMISEHLDAASAAFQVGYESPSHFSREYRRLYGLPPKKDIENQRVAGALLQL
ncbi:AraC family transcriptional regulator [Shewanella sp. C32]|uniref:AraC family transcriptional regulator n=1 Tax=Shewanella electrica TaxID=515560 RepID=A0ABT2FFQ6_9GAMM|nr:AraC family transcriptional regulator [Shewanella electrica]MCH1925294.1 AraC family transcriptional regulator [Shewanella electrica]MCS4555119.1 AraC family transcriptional regulator [Shewanella electrica]